MCGIFSFVTNHQNGFTSKEADFVSMMVYLTTLRGEDSTGVMSMDYNGNVDIVKDAIDGPSFLRTKEYKAWRTNIVTRGKIVVGHNRAATRGSIIDKNAHPFIVDDNIVLVQNGTYKGSHKHLKDVEVDTEAVAHTIAKYDDPEEAFKHINAAYALMWFDIKKQSLFTVRNKERPLVWARFKGGGVACASEAAFIRMAADRAGMELLEDDPYILKEDHLVQVVLKDKKAEYIFKDVDTKFDYKNGPQQEPSFRHSVVYQGGSHIQHHPNFQRSRGNDVEILIRDAVSDMKECPVMPMGVAPSKSYTSGTEVIMETLDYFHCNNSPNCTAFWVVGREVSATNDNSDWPLVYFKMEDTTEQEVMIRCYEGFFKGKVDFGLTFQVWNHGEKQGTRFLWKLEEKSIDQLLVNVDTVCH